MGPKKPLGMEPKKPANISLNMKDREPKLCAIAFSAKNCIYTNFYVSGMPRQLFGILSGKISKSSFLNHFYPHILSLALAHSCEIIEHCCVIMLGPTLNNML